MFARRTLLGLAATLPLLFAAPAIAQDKASLRLNWYLGGLHVPFYYGVAKGFFKDEGIDLTINEGRGSANTSQVVAAGSDTFGMADSTSLISLVAKGGEVSIRTRIDTLGSTVAGVQELIVYGLKGVAAYADHAEIDILAYAPPAPAAELGEVDADDLL